MLNRVPSWLLVALAAALLISGTTPLKQPLTPHQWARKYSCSKANSSEGHLASLLAPVTTFATDHDDEASECIEQREPSAWVYKYLDELEPSSFRVLVMEESLDERLANILYAVATSPAVDVNRFKFNSGDEQQNELNRKLVAGPKVQEQLCSKHLQAMLALIDDLGARLRAKRLALGQTVAKLNESHLRLGRVLDSFGRYESGFQAGRSTSIGSPRQCSETPLLLGPDFHKPVGMRFCWANLNVSRHLDSGLASRAELPHELSGHLNVGFCLPDSCHSLSYRLEANKLQALINTQFKLPQTIYYDPTELQLDGLFCAPDSDSEYSRLSLATILFATCLLAWTSLVLVATYLERCSQICDKSTFWSQMSLTNSWRSLMESQRRASLLSALDGIRVLLCVSIVLGHVTFHGPFYASNILQTLKDGEMDPRLTILQMIIFYVDTFFVMSSLLTAYWTLKRLRSTGGNGPIKTKGNSLSDNFLLAWLNSSLMRYFRLVPVYLFTNTFARLILPHLFDGPMWDYRLNKDTNGGACDIEPWYTALTWASIYRACPLACLPQSWSVGMELLYGFLLPPLLLLIHKLPKLMVKCVFLLILVVFLLSNVDFSRHVNDPIMWETYELRLHGNFYLRTSLSRLYTSPLYRAPVFLFGILAGYYIYSREINTNEEAHKKGPWFLGPYMNKFCCLTLVTYGILVAIHQRARLFISPAHRLIFWQYFTGSHLGWALACSVLLIAVCSKQNQNSPLVRFLSLDLWQPLAKLTYSIYLIHLPLYRTILELDEQILILSFWKYMQLSVIVIGLTVPLSVVVFLLIECPIDKLIRNKLLRPLFERCANKIVKY